MRSIRRLTQTGAALLFAALLMCASTAIAAAHAARIAADPADKSTVQTGPQRVSATFNEQMQGAFAAMTVVGPDGNLWSTGDPQVSGAVLAVAVRPLGPVGTYTVNYRATSADGHVVSGSWTFQLAQSGTGAAGPPAGAPAEPASTADPADPVEPADPDMPVWPFVLGATLIIAGGALWAVRRNR